MFADALKQKGFEVFEATNGKEALDIWQKNSFDLIWLDIFMPYMDGYDVARHIRKAEAEQNTHIIIIALSASVFEADNTIALDAGCDDFLLKPYRLSDMYELIAKHLKIEYVYENRTEAETKVSPLTPEQVAHILEDF